VGSVASGVNALHAETMERLAEHGERLGRIELDLERHGEHLVQQGQRLNAIDQRLALHGELLGALVDQGGRHEELLQELLRRLPGSSGGAPEDEG
jgi:hypothetical protein